MGGRGSVTTNLSIPMCNKKVMDGEKGFLAKVRRKELERWYMLREFVWQ